MDNKTAMEKLASDPKAQAAAKLIEKLAYNEYLGNVRQALMKKHAEEMPMDEAIEMVAQAIEEDPDSVPDEIKQEFIAAVMSDPEMGPAMEEEVKQAMAKDPTRKDLYKAAFYKQAQQSQIVKVAEEIAMANTPEGEPVDPEMIEAIIEMIEEQEGGAIPEEAVPGEEPLGEGGLEEELTEEDLSPEMVAEALAEDNDPIMEGDPKEVIAMKVAGLVRRNYNLGRVKTAQAIADRYLK